MTKYSGMMGYVTPVQSSPGVWVNHVIEKKVRGDVIRSITNNLPGDTTADDVTISNRISIVGDPYAFENFFNIKYVKYMRVNWKVINIELARPRIILTLGGVWNGETPEPEA